MGLAMWPAMPAPGTFPVFVEGVRGLADDRQIGRQLRIRRVAS
jgi:hypothetical protein